MNTPPPRIFISHSNKDHNFCRQLVEDLRRALGDADAVWYDALGLQGGESWWSKIMLELKSRNAFIVVLSPDAMTSDYVNDEINMAWGQKNSPARMRLFPVLYRPCEVQIDLKSLQIISFVAPKSHETAFEELLLALGPATSKNTSNATQKAAHTPQRIKEPQPAKGIIPIALDPNVIAQVVADHFRTTQLKPQDASVYSNRGNAFYDHKQYEQLIADCDRVIQSNPQDSNAYINRGLAYYALKHYGQARADYDRAIQLKPQDTSAYNNRGNSYYALKQYELAIADYDRAIQLNSQDASAYNNRGNTYYTLKQYELAIADYDRAILFNPQHTKATYWREQALQRLLGK